MQKAKNSISPFYAYLVLAILMLAYISSFVDRQIVAVLAVQIKKELALSNFQSGLLYGTAFSFIYAFAGIFMGRMADLYHRKRLILWGLVCWSGATIASGWAGSFLFLVGMRMVVGLSQSMLSPAVYSLLADYFPPSRRATVYSLYASSIFVGVALSFLVGGSVAQTYDWRTAMIAVGAPGLAIALLGQLIIKEVSRGRFQKMTTGSKNAISREPENMWAVLRYMLRKKTIRWHLAGFSFLAFLGYTILAFISTVLVETYQRPELVTHYGWFLLGTGVTVTLSGKLADVIARKSGNPARRFVMGIVAALGGLPFYWMGLLSDGGFQALIWCGVAVMFSSSYNGVAAALLQYLVTSKMRAMAGGLYLFVISVVGFGIGPPATGWLMDHVFTGEYGPGKSLLLVITLCGLAATACFLAAMRTYADDAVD